MSQLVGKEVSPIGFDLMGLTWRPTPCPQEQAFEAMRAALKNGSNFWNGGEFYGPPDYNSLVLLERYFEKYPKDADKVVISIKGGVNPKTHQVDASPENTRRTLDDSIAQPKGRKKIDMFEFGRQDPAVPMEVTFSLIEKEYIQTGKIRGISLSEVRAEMIHEAVKYTKVLVVEVQLSLFSTDILENGVAAACAQYGIPLVAYSPIGRGMFWPLAEKVEEITKKNGCTSAQLAINWTMALSRRPGMPTIIPIPGATTGARVEENNKLIDITDEEMAQIDAILARFTTAGER